MPRKKASKTTAKNAFTKKVTELNQAHGKVEGPEPTTLDQIWGDTGYEHPKGARLKSSPFLLSYIQNICVI
jgi:hypothetical protein